VLVSQAVALPIYAASPIPHFASIVGSCPPMAS